MAQEWAEWFYKSREWEACRNGFLESKHYICERCGRIAKIAHHKIHLTPQNINDPNITLNWDLLEALCQDCHTKEHLNSEVCAEGLTFDSEGNLIQTPPPDRSTRCPLQDRGGNLKKPLQGINARKGWKYYGNSESYNYSR